MNETILVDRDREIDNTTPAQDDELALYKRAVAKIEAVCREVAAGNLEARLVDIESFGASRRAMRFPMWSHVASDATPPQGRLAPPKAGRFSPLASSRAA